MIDNNSVQDATICNLRMKIAGKKTKKLIDKSQPHMLTDKLLASPGAIANANGQATAKTSKKKNDKTNPAVIAQESNLAALDLSRSSFTTPLPLRERDTLAERARERGRERRNIQI